MSVRFSCLRPLPRAASAMPLLVLGIGLAGCGSLSDSALTMAFADPARYELYDCKQLEAERKNLAARAADVQGLMTKAETGVAGSVVAELAYRNEYIAIRGQTRFADAAWEKNKCQAAAPAVAAPAPAPALSSAPSANVRSAQPPVRSGNAVY